MRILTEPSIDYLRLSESGQFDVLNDGMVVRLDAKGEVLWHTPLSMTLEGSYSTKCKIRVQDNVREMTWNPSRLGREENGLGVDFDAAMMQADRLMKFFDQPAWKDAELHRYHDGEAYATGTVATRIDLACLVQIGSERKAREFLRQFYNRKLSRQQPQRRGNTVYHGGKDATGRTVKAYLKGPEVLAHAKRKISGYQKRFADWCTSRGIVRVEIRYGRKALAKLGLREVARATHAEALVSLFGKELQEILMKNHTEPDLSALDWRVRGTYYMYMAGERIKELVSTATFYRHRKQILECTGIDIANDNVIAFKQKPVVLQPVVMTPEMMPDWYRHPTGKEVDEFIEKVEANSGKKE